MRDDAAPSAGMLSVSPNVAFAVPERTSAGIGVDVRGGGVFFCGGSGGGALPAGGGGGGGAAATGCAPPRCCSASGSLGTNSRILWNTSAALSRALFSMWILASSLSTLTVLVF